MPEHATGSYRFVICVDVNAESLRKAYDELWLMMAARPDPDLIDWESTDEVYDPAGVAVPEADVTQARMAVFAKYNDA